MKPKTSDIWQYFLEVDDNYAKCKICYKNYSRKGRTTTSLKLHLKSMHKDKFEELCQIEEQRKTKTQQEQTPVKQTNGQMSIEESKKIQIWDTSHTKAKKMDDLIGEMIALQDLPFNFVEGIGFRRVIQAALPSYQLRGRQFFTDHICEEIYTKIDIKIRQMLNQFLKLSFTLDVWSEPTVDGSLWSLTAHGITEDFTRKQIVLKCCSFHGCHTGNIICDHFKTLLQDWDLQDEQLHCFIRNDDSNMVRAMLSTNIPDVNCTVHQLQLCISILMETCSDLITSCKKISDHFMDCQMAQDELFEIQTEHLNQPALRVIQDCDTRWNSTFYMIERLLKIKDSISLYASKHNIPQISPEEWLCLNKMVAILTPFEEITRNLSDSKTCISSVIPLIHVLKHTLHIEKEKFDTNQNFKSIIQKLLEEINTRFGDLTSNTIYSLATYLDPRYKLKFFNNIIKELVQSELLRLLILQNLNETKAEIDDEGFMAKRPKIETDPLEEDLSTSSQILPSAQSVHSNLADMLNSSDAEEETKYDSSVTTSNIMIWKSLINEYNKENRLQLDEDPLLWWKYNIKYKDLAPIVRAYLSPPGSLREQLFSEARLIEPVRNRLEDEKAAKLLYIKYNLPLINFDYQ